MTRMNHPYPVFRVGSRATVVPVVHGSGDFAWQVRHMISQGNFDCLAVPLPNSFQEPVEQAILELPVCGIVAQHESVDYEPTFDPEATEEDDDAIEFEEGPSSNYVPIDPCQPVIAALRVALEERIPRRFIDKETACFEPYAEMMPDPYALKQVSLEQFAAAVLPTLSEPDEAQWQSRIRFMAYQLRELCIDFENVLFVCSILDWPWIRTCFQDRDLVCPEHDSVETPEHSTIDNDTLYFMLGELPFVTGLYEKARANLEVDDNLSIDGVKELLISARSSYRQDYGKRARKITPHLLKTCLKYSRNLSLIYGRLTPDLMTLITAAKQTAGDGYALHVLETARNYPFAKLNDTPTTKIGIAEARFPNDDVRRIKNRLAGPPVAWSNIQLTPKPDQNKREEWSQRWNPYSHCSWPPEDVQIENFRQAVFDKAQSVVSNEMAKTEKFTTSIKDGIDIRDTLRHWYDGNIYVKEIPPNRGHLDCAVMLFDSPSDPRDYPWRVTWYAEHLNESTLCFYATDFQDEPVGPGICLSTYGGAMFLFPPLAVPDIWQDPRLNFTETLEERLLAAACLHSSQPRIALLSANPPGQAYRQLASHYKKSWIHVPLSHFSDSTVQQLRMVHVLNGKEVRSYAADFIRKS